MKNIDNLHTIGKSSKKHSTRGKSFGYQILGFGSGGAAAANLFVVATGGCITTCGDYKVHAFTGDATFCVSSAGTCAGSETVDYAVVAGGGGGGGCFGGAGAGGGFRFSNGYCLPGPTTHPNASPAALPVSVQGYPITIGGGGAGWPSVASGEDSVFSSITSAGGGRGANFSGVGTDGGSGGGAAGSGNAGGAGNTPPTSPLPPQGSNGGTGYSQPCYRTGGAGGGAAAFDPQANAATNGGLGGVGAYISPSFAVSCAGTSGPVGSTRYFSGGGGGGGFCPGHAGGAGGAGGGGRGGSNPSTASTAGGDNTGGGGGAGAGGPAPGSCAAAGGSGVVLIRYKFQ